jgi:hypothetical protein
MAGTGANSHWRFYNDALGTPSQVGTITSTGTATVYGTSSDATLKEDDGELTFDQARAILDLVAFHNFRWKLDGKPDHGVFAQELFEVYPGAVTPGGWYNDLTGEAVPKGAEGAVYYPWSVDYSKLMTVVGRCVQGVMIEQDELRGELNMLKSAA